MSSTQPINQRTLPSENVRELSPEFVDAYQDEILADFDSEAFISELPDDIEVIAFFCVEHEPGACHRSLVAEKLASDTNLRIVHIT